MSQDWWRTFFDEDYLRLWGASIPDDQSDREADGLWELLQLQEGSRLLDAPCGYGRLSKRLAERGIQVLGVDQSEPLLAFAEETRGHLLPDQLQYLRQDLRQPLEPGGFDAVINIFSSLGYGTEEDDITILTNLGLALRPGGRLFVETNHRDSAVLTLSRIEKPALRLPDGTLIIEEPKLDIVTGRVEATWFWSGPQGQGEKSGSFRVYSATELISLLGKAGLRLLSAHQGCSTRLFSHDRESFGGRLGLLLERPFQ